MIIFTVNETPISLNNAYPSRKRGGRFLTPEGERFKNLVGLNAKVAKNKINEELEGPYEVTIDFHFKDKRKRDIDNYAKLILDSMTGIIWDDDSEIHALHLYKNYSELPYFEVQINSFKKD